MLLTVLLAVVMTTTAVALKVPISRHFNGGFQCDFCDTLNHFVHGWKAHILFSHAVDSLDVYASDSVEKLQSGREFVIHNKDYNGNVEAGEQLCIKFTAHSHNAALPQVYFYVEGIEHPVDTHGVTHPIPATTRDPQLSHVHALWSMKNVPRGVTDPLTPFHSQPGGHFDEGSLSVAADPTGHPGNVLKVYYQKGHYVSIHSHRGAQFYSKPVDPRTSMTLSYDIYFSPGFNFVKGGKLPGLFGGATNCSGGRHSDACFSTRLMWREQGDGEVYAYIPEHQDTHLCHTHGNICNPDYGTSLGRGMWRWKTGAWQNIAQHVVLNTPGQTNGRIKVWLDGQPVLEMNNINLRARPEITIDGLFFSTFFGGSDPSWAPAADCYTYYKNFVLSADAAPAIVIG